MVRDYSTAYVFTTGNRTKGLGHLYRCLNLATALQPRVESQFLYHNAPDEFFRLLQRTHIRGTAMTHRKMRALQQQLARQIVVIDGIEHSQEDVTAWREQGNVVVCIDDAWESHYACDLVIAHGPHRHHGQPSDRDECRFLVGPEYALINRVFYDTRRAWTSEVEKVFINFGGADPLDFTAFILDQPCLRSYECHVVLGTEYRGKADDIAAFNPKMHIYEKLSQSELAGVMAQCDLAIGSGGGLSLELGAIGLPTVLIAVADDQVEPCKAFHDQGLAWYAGNIASLTPDVFQKTFEAFVSGTASRRDLYHETQKVFRRPGITHVAKVIQGILQAKKKGVPRLVHA